MIWDEALFYWLNGLAGQSAVMDWVMYQASQTRNLFLPVLLAVGYWLWTNGREAVIGSPTLGILIGISDFLGGQLKHLIERPRPCKIFHSINELVGCGGTFSMPSNHAMNTATAAAFLQILYPTTGLITWPLVGLVGVSRVYLGAHYVTDVLAGWIVGGALGIGMGWLLTRWSRFGRVWKEVNQ